MSFWFYFFAAIYSLAVFGLGFWGGFHFAFLSVVRVLRKSITGRETLEFNGVRFLAVVTNPNVKG